MSLFTDLFINFHFLIRLHTLFHFVIKRPIVLHVTKLQFHILVYIVLYIYTVNEPRHEKTNI